jgi:hypothetical protein
MDAFRQVTGCPAFLVCRGFSSFPGTSPVVQLPWYVASCPAFLASYGLSSFPGKLRVVQLSWYVAGCPAFLASYGLSSLFVQFAFISPTLVTPFPPLSLISYFRRHFPAHILTLIMKSLFLHHDILYILDIEDLASI